MKRVKSNLTTLVVALVVLFAACDKDVETSALELNKDKSAIIKGYVYAELDRTSAGVEAAPAGTLIAIKIANSDYKTGVAGAYTDTVKTDANGMFTIEVPADDNGVTVNITPIPFEADQVQGYGIYEESVRKIYSATAVALSVSSGDIKIQQITYAVTDFTNFVPMVEVSGEILADLNDTITGSELLEQSIEITFHTADWMTSITTNSDGTYSVVVPRDVEILITSKFEASVYIDGEGRLNYEFEKKAEAFDTFTATSENEDIDFETGTLVE